LIIAAPRAARRVGDGPDVRRVWVPRTMPMAPDQRLRRQPTSQSRFAGRPAGSLAVALRLAYL